MEKERKYQFCWDDTVGADIKAARPNLGPNTRVEVYRLFQYTLRDVTEQRYGTEAADELLFDAGFLAGKVFYEKFLNESPDVSSLAAGIQESFNTMGIGIFRVEEAAEDSSRFVFTVDEDIDCSGLPDTREVVCVYDEGFIKGILESFYRKKFNVKEIDCWCSGARTCRFEANIAS